jgi:hypothetical protein
LDLVHNLPIDNIGTDRATYIPHIHINRKWKEKITRNETIYLKKIILWYINDFSLHTIHHSPSQTFMSQLSSRWLVVKSSYTYFCIDEPLCNLPIYNIGRKKDCCFKVRPSIPPRLYKEMAKNVMTIRMFPRNNCFKN